MIISNGSMFCIKDFALLDDLFFVCVKASAFEKNHVIYNIYIFIVVLLMSESIGVHYTSLDIYLLLFVRLINVYICEYKTIYCIFLT